MKKSLIVILSISLFSCNELNIVDNTSSSNCTSNDTTSLSSSAEILSDNNFSNNITSSETSSSAKNELKLEDKKYLNNGYIKYLDGDYSSSISYYVTPTGFDLEELNKQNYYINICIKYEVYYKKDYNILWDIGYFGAPKYERYLLNTDNMGKFDEDIKTYTARELSSISITISAQDLINTRFILTFSTNNIQNIICFENIVAYYTCLKF